MFSKVLDSFTSFSKMIPCMAKKKQTLDKEEPNFFSDVYEVVKLIPRGRVTSYGAIARYLVQA